MERIVEKKEGLGQTSPTIGRLVGKKFMDNNQ